MFTKQKLPILALLALAISTSFTHAQDKRPDCHVLAVGIDRYQNINALKGCVADAENAVNVFRQQEGALFGKVAWTMLSENSASAQRIDEAMKSLARAGKAGDSVVLFLSGHGNRRNKTWAFLAQDFKGDRAGETSISDQAILRFADGLASEGKRVFIIIDACFAGQLRLNAREILARHRNPNGGGIILMVSSMPSQVSIACGPYSAFAFAVKEGMEGKADYNTNGEITLQELRRYVYHRVYELHNSDQDGEIDYSLSLSDATVVAKKTNNHVAQQQQPIAPQQANVIKGQLTNGDAFDRLRQGSHAKVYTINVNVGKIVIDLTSGQGPGFFDTYLRVEDLNGNVLAENDDHGGTLNSHVTLNITRAGQIRVIVTTYAPGVTGDFELRVR